MDDVHLDPGIQCYGCWTSVMSLSSLGPKALRLWQPGKASVSIGSRVGGKTFYSRFSYTRFLSNLSVEFSDNLSDGQQGLTPSQVSSEAATPFPLSLGAAKKKRFHVVFPDTKVLRTSPTTSEISQPACRSSPTARYKWLPNKHFLHTKLEKKQQNQQGGDSEGKKEGQTEHVIFPLLFGFFTWVKFWEC